MSEGKIQILRPFGPTVAKIELPGVIVNKLNDYTDNIILNDNDSKKLDHGKNLAGNVKQEILLTPDILKSSGFMNFLVAGTKKWLDITENKKISKFHITASWVVRQFKNEYNPIHNHNGHVSGVGYLKVPDNFGKTFQSTKISNDNGKLSLIHGNRIFNCQSEYKVVPKIGDFYIFPNYLMHTVYPFYDNNDERRSVSFNAIIDDDIYNKFGD